MDFKIIHIAETDSTNRWLRSFCSKDFCSKENRREGESLQSGVEKTPKLLNTLDNNSSLAVIAEYQTAGKGCGTNSWESERGKNLTFSILICPEDIPANEQFRIKEITSVTMCETLEKYIPQKTTIKWPNDIYVGDRKICGMLIENQLQGNRIKSCIIGIGLNVNQRVFLSDAPNPVSIYQLTGRDTDLEHLLRSFLETFEVTFKSKANRHVYEDRLYRKDGWHTFEDENSRFPARLTGVTAEGRLRLLDERGQERVYGFKEVRFVI